LPNVKKGSLFAKQMHREGKLQTCKDLDQSKDTTKQLNLPRSSILTGQGLGDVTGEREIQRIHHENVNLLTSMNESEILAERERLIKSLGKFVMVLKTISRSSSKDVRSQIDRIHTKSTKARRSRPNAIPIKTQWLNDRCSFNPDE
jgi:hypothetical protein